jgi:hypothetical protein
VKYLLLALYLTRHKMGKGCALFADSQHENSDLYFTARAVLENGSGFEPSPAFLTSLIARYPEAAHQVGALGHNVSPASSTTVEHVCMA